MSNKVKSGSKFAFLDIDGVLANTAHREHFVLEGTSPNWQQFFHHMDADTPHTQGYEVYNALVTAGYTIVYLTGRNENYRARTLKWLDDNGFGLEYPLEMRPVLSYTKLDVFKMDTISEWKRFHHLAAKNIMVIDDDPRVTTAAKANGYVPVFAKWQPKNRRLMTKGTA